MPAPTSTGNDNQAAVAAIGQQVVTEEQKKEDEQKKRSLTPEKKVKVAKRIVKASKESFVGHSILCLNLVFVVCINNSVCCASVLQWVRRWSKRV